MAPPLASETFCDPPRPQPRHWGIQTWECKAGGPRRSSRGQGVCPSAIWNREGTEGSANPGVTQSMRWFRFQLVSLVCVFLEFVHFIEVGSFVGVRSVTASPFFSVRSMVMSHLSLLILVIFGYLLSFLGQSG